MIIWEPSFIKLKFLKLNRPWESFAYLMRNGPDRYSIRTKFFTQEILMELHKGIDAIG